jgi:hypothetical protein
MMLAAGIILLTGVILWSVSLPGSPMRSGLSYACLPFVWLAHAALLALRVGAWAVGAIVAYDLLRHLIGAEPGHRRGWHSYNVLWAPFHIAFVVAVLCAVAAIGVANGGHRSPHQKLAEHVPVADLIKNARARCTGTNETSPCWFWKLSTWHLAAQGSL